VTRTEIPYELDADEVKSVADEIERYLATRSGSADTLEGVIHWWLMQQRVIETKKLVERAILSLCEEGKIETRRLADGTDFFIAKKSG
jgi:hypothetical protein